jgi:hypothetical protein
MEMIRMTTKQVAGMAWVGCMALTALFAVSAVVAADTGQQQEKGKAVMPEPIPAEALDKMPPEATGYCHDGTWWTAAVKQGACSGHGGVQVWFGPPPQGTTGRCMDGMYTRVKKGTGGACSGHGGVRMWWSPPAQGAKPAHK